MKYAVADVMEATGLSREGVHGRLRTKVKHGDIVLHDHYDIVGGKNMPIFNEEGFKIICEANQTGRPVGVDF